MSRAPNTKVPLTARIPERLRQRLEEAAKENENSLNSELISRLERSFSEEDRFGGAHNLAVVDTLGQILRLVEFQEKKRWYENDDTKAQMHAAISVFLDGFFKMNRKKILELLFKNKASSGLNAAITALKGIGMSDEQIARNLGTEDLPFTIVIMDSDESETK